jgi:hypothetical protein
MRAQAEVPSVQRPDDTDARNDVLGCFGRSDRRAQQTNNHLMI